MLVHANTPEGLDAIHHAAEHFNADPDYVLGTGACIGTNLETGSDAEQRADARRAYEKDIDAQAAAGALEDRTSEMSGKTLSIIGAPPPSTKKPPQAG